MQIVGMLGPSTRCLSWKGQVPHLLCRVPACVCHLRDQAPHLRTSCVVLCGVGAANGADWGEQPGPTCGKNKTAYPPALPASFSDCDRGQGVKFSLGCPAHSCHRQHCQWVLPAVNRLAPHLFLTVRMMSPTRFLSVCICCLSVLTKHA